MYISEVCEQSTMGQDKGHVSGRGGGGLCSSCGGGAAWEFQIGILMMMLLLIKQVQYWPPGADPQERTLIDLCRNCQWSIN